MKYKQEVSSLISLIKLSQKRGNLIVSWKFKKSLLSFIKILSFEGVIYKYVVCNDQIKLYLRPYKPKFVPKYFKSFVSYKKNQIRLVKYHDISNTFFFTTSKGVKVLNSSSFLGGGIYLINF